MVFFANPFLADTIERAGRDPVRKLGYGDRIFGTMALALEQGIEPASMALGAMAAIAVVIKEIIGDELPSELRFNDWRKLAGAQIGDIIKWIWADQAGEYGPELTRLVRDAHERLKRIV